MFKDRKSFLSVINEIALIGRKSKKGPCNRRIAKALLILSYVIALTIHASTSENVPSDIRVHPLPKHAYSNILKILSPKNEIF